MASTLSVATAILVSTVLALTNGVGAATLEGTVKDESGRSLADAVIFATPVGGVPAPAARKTRVMDQLNMEYVPNVLPVEVGTTVKFPNNDNIRHHIYSFLGVKQFERPLYTGMAAEPVTFDTPGEVVLGCNIHDWMLGYIYVVATPFFAKTSGNGSVRIEKLSPGDYDVRVWHPRLRAVVGSTVQRITLSATAPARVAFVIALKPDIRRPRPPDANQRYKDQTGG